MRITRDRHNALVEGDNIAFTYSAIENPRDLVEMRTKEADFDWGGYGMWMFDDFIIHPFGTNNDLPEKIRNIVQQNYIAPGLLSKKKLLLWGQGPKLFVEVVEDKQIFKDWKDYKDKEAKEIYKWLESWGYETYLEECITSYQYMQGVFSKAIRRKGARIGQPFINKLEHISQDHCRLATKANNNQPLLQKYNKPTNAVVTDYTLNHVSDLLNYKVYPLFDRANPFQHAQSISYAKMSSFLQDIYTIPDIYGSLEWLKRSTAIPLILQALSKNSINLKYHIESPQAYWDSLETKLKEQCTEKGIVYKSEMLKEKETQILKQISDILGGEDNTGKFMHTKKIIEVDGTNLLEHGWTIKEINQNIKDFVTAQLDISKRADYAVAASINIHSALGGISESGKSDSGSEQLYAYMIYLLVANDLPEMIVCKHLNETIKANFPGTDLKIGFYHQQPQRQQDVSSKDRIDNKIQ